MNHSVDLLNPSHLIAPASLTEANVTTTVAASEYAVASGVFRAGALCDGPPLAGP
jgi:hypothetical protein